MSASQIHLELIQCTLKIPQTLNVTTDVRLIKKNSDEIITNANTPPAKIVSACGDIVSSSSHLAHMILTVNNPSSNVTKKTLPKMVGYPSTAAARINSTTA